MDRLYGFVMQHGQEPFAEGLTDTMIDLILGAVGALAAMFVETFKIVGYIGKDRKANRAAYRAKREAYKAQGLLASPIAWMGCMWKRYIHKGIFYHSDHPFLWLLEIYKN